MGTRQLEGVKGTKLKKKKKDPPPTLRTQGCLCQQEAQDLNTWAEKPAFPSRDLDCRFLGGAEEGHVGDADEGPFLAGPEPDDRTLLGDLGSSIKVGEAHAAQVGG